MILGKRKGLFGHRQKCPPSLHPILEREEGALPPVKEGGGESLFEERVKSGKGKGFFHPFPN